MTFGNCVSAVELGVGVDVALLVSGGVEMNGIAFVEFRGLLNAWPRHSTPVLTSSNHAEL